MLIIPAIDLKDGKCVRLKQGRMDDPTIFSDDPIAMAARWVSAGARRLHLVDLNGAFEGKPVNGEIISTITKEYPTIPVQVGGGIRDFDTIEYYLGSGVQFVILGTKALKDPSFVKEACSRFKGHIIVGIDAIDGLVATEGWAEVSKVEATELAAKFKDVGVSSIVYTDIGRDGMMQGANSEATAQLARTSGLPVIASGGVTDMEDIQSLKAVADAGIIGVITGRAIYEGTLDLARAQSFCDE